MRPLLLMEAAYRFALFLTAGADRIACVKRSITGLYALERKCARSGRPPPLGGAAAYRRIRRGRELRVDVSASECLEGYPFHWTGSARGREGKVPNARSSRSTQMAQKNRCAREAPWGRAG